MRIPPTTRSPVAMRSRGDDIARAFRHELLDTFREPVFRESEVAPAAEIYVSDRTWMASGQPPAPRMAFEHHLYQQLHSHSPSFVLVIAGAGVGKSTFLKYFFRHFEPRPAGIPMPPPHEQFLLLDCDIRQPEPQEAAKERAYEAWFDILNEEFKASHNDIDVRDWDDYAIYDILQHWPPHVTSTESREMRIERRLRARDAHKFDHRELLRAAIRLRRDIAQDSRRKLVFLPDNLDQNDLTCQHALVTDVLHIVEEFGSEEAMLVLPLRPESRARFAQRRFPLPNNPLELELGACDEALLIGSRLSCLRSYLGRSHRIVDIDMVDEFGDRAFTPIRALRAAEILGDAIRWGLEDRIAGSPDPALAVLGSIVSGSARRSKDLRLRVALSGVAKQKRLMRQRPHLSAYAFLDAYLSGEEGKLVPGSTGCSLINLFDTTRSGAQREDAAFATIVGVHFLFLLRGGKLETSQIRGDLRAIGYPAQFIEECLATYKECGVIHLIEVEKSGNQEIMVEAELAEAHYCLLAQPAYVDHVAMTTPVDPKRAAEMRITSGNDPEDFLTRIRTTIQFLEQIREDERSVFGMTHHYRVRLEGILKDKKLPLEVDEFEFRRLLDDEEILHVSRDDAQRPFIDW